MTPLFGHYSKLAIGISVARRGSGKDRVDGTSIQERLLRASCKAA
jgi:hypothetical protein